LSISAAEDFSTLLSQRVAAERLVLAEAWLARLKELLPVDANEVFPSSELLDHIPALIGQVAAYLRAPAHEEIAANAAVIAKAGELGALRYAQKASVHQLLREYEILGDVLHNFVADETRRLGLAPSSTDCFEVLGRLTHAVAALMRTTVDTFVSAYTATIQEQNERLRSFNRTASHELRSSIGTIMFAASLLDKDRERIVRDDERLTKIAATIRTNTERLLWLVQNLQRMARLSEPADLPNEQRVEVETVANEVAAQLAEMAASRGVSIRVVQGLPTIVVDAARLELILLNLVSNGIKYSNPQQSDRFVEIAPASRDDAGPGQCSIVVRDNGLGIPDAQQAAIFDRFVRAHAHLDRQLGVTGSGLGLAIVADCVAAVGGSVRLESVEGRGTSFWITFETARAGA